MNAYLLTMIWILGAVLVLMLLCYVISGFDLGALVLVSILWCIPTLPFLLFIACSFIFGLKGLDHLYWAIGSLCVYGLLTYMLLTSCQMAADPKIVHGTLKVVLFLPLLSGVAVCGSRLYAISLLYWALQRFLQLCVLCCYWVMLCLQICEKWVESMIYTGQDPI